MRDRPWDASAMLQHPDVERLAARLAQRTFTGIPDDAGGSRAAVALLLRLATSGTLEMLMIERAARVGDPWSGHVALPGGRHDPSDASLIDTAIRETLEETAIDLTRDGCVIGVLDDVRPRTIHLPPIIIRPFVALVAPDVAIEPSDEVAESFWVPVSAILDPASAGEATVTVASGQERVVSSYQVVGRVVWGLTERILHQFVAEVWGRV
jgi:8-oxo-dGTP pyrophosphatase MutT (NUDIX family)